MPFQHGLLSVVKLKVDIPAIIKAASHTRKFTLYEIYVSIIVVLLDLMFVLKARAKYTHI